MVTWGESSWDRIWISCWISSISCPRDFSGGGVPGRSLDVALNPSSVVGGVATRRGRCATLQATPSSIALLSPPSSWSGWRRTRHALWTEALRIPSSCPIPLPRRSSSTLLCAGNHLEQVSYIVGSEVGQWPWVVPPSLLRQGRRGLRTSLLLSSVRLCPR